MPPASCGPEILARFCCRLRDTASATHLLAAWCVERGIGEGRIRARRHPGPPAPAPEDTLALLGTTEGLRHRRVTLTRGEVALSDCDIWWLPSRLTPAMQAELDATDHPFGLVVAALRPVRRVLSQTLLPAAGPHMLEHRALMLAGDGEQRAIALVRELYRRVLTE